MVVIQIWGSVNVTLLQCTEQSFVKYLKPTSDALWLLEWLKISLYRGEAWVADKHLRDQKLRLFFTLIFFKSNHESITTNLYQNQTFSMFNIFLWFGTRCLKMCRGNFQQINLKISKLKILIYTDVITADRPTRVVALD